MIQGYAKISLKKELTYKSGLIAEFLSSPIHLIIMIMVWTSVYNYSGTAVIGGLNLQEMITYYVIFWISGSIIMSDADWDLGWDIHRGHLVHKLLKPVKYHALKLSMELGNKVGLLLIQVIPFIIISALFFNLRLASMTYTLIAVASFALAYLINFFFTLSYSLLFFKLTEYRYFTRIVRKITAILSGKVFPLSLLPLSFYAVIQWLPFQYIGYVPASIFLGKYEISESLLMLLIQGVWIAIFYTIYRIGWSKSLKEFGGVGV